MLKLRLFTLGYEILKKVAKKGSMPKLMFSGENFDDGYKEFINNLFIKIEKLPDVQNEIVKYLKYCFDEPISSENDFEKKESYYKYMRDLRYTTLNGIKVKSEDEREIMNFFITHNLNGKKISVKYEDPAEWMISDNKGEKNAPKPDFYFPDFNLYLEHWALNKEGKVPDWFDGENPTQHYKQSMQYKKGQFDKQTQYKLIETYSWERRDANFNHKLQNRFVTALNEQKPKELYELTDVPYEELVERVWTDGRQTVKSLPGRIADFIVIAKTYNLDPVKIKNRLNEDKWSKKQHIFGIIALKVYEEYQNELKKSGKIDFGDMINTAIKELKQNNTYFDKFDHILIDEYQDISAQRFNLIKALMEKNLNCKLFCVGDDWQSIMELPVRIWNISLILKNILSTMRGQTYWKIIDVKISGLWIPETKSLNKILLKSQK